MPLDHRQRLKVALAVRHALQRAAHRRRSRTADILINALSNTDRLATLSRQLAVVTRNGWTHASGRLVRESRRLLSGLQDTEMALGRAVGQFRPVPALRDVYDDLQQLEEEFGDVQYRASERMLTATTDVIELEGIYLGPFSIELHINHLVDASYAPLYTIAALDPHPAMSNEGVTHPHVNDGVLCAGDGAAAICIAFQEGRLCDAFLMIRSVLDHYNASSPYVSLEDWSGVCCDDCGTLVPEDDTYYCHSCDDRLCDGCSPSCAYCDTTTCAQCLSRCPECEDDVCPDCLTKCPQCDAVLCEGCLERGCACQEEPIDETTQAEEHAHSVVVR